MQPRLTIVKWSLSASPSCFISNPSFTSFPVGRKTLSRNGAVHLWLRFHITAWLRLNPLRQAGTRLNADSIGGQPFLVKTQRPFIPTYQKSANGFTQFSEGRPDS